MKKNKMFFLIGILVLILTPLAQILMSNKTIVDNSKSDFNSDNQVAIEKETVIGYCQAIEYAEAVETFYYTLKGLEKTGQISNLNLEYIPYETTGEELWNYVCENVQSDKLIFKKENFFDLDKGDLEKVKELLVDEKIDFLITFGTAAGKELFSDFHNVKTINVASSDPLGAGFIKSNEYSGSDHLWAMSDDSRYYRQLKMFRDATGYKKLGVIRYVDSFRRVFTPEMDIERLSKEENFQVEIYDIYNIDTIFSSSGLDEYYEELRKAHEYLAENCDAFYMTIGGWKYGDLPELLDPFYKKNIPVFSQFGSIEVSNGALMSVGKKSFDQLGIHLASIIVRSINGEKLGGINQVFTEVQSMTYNVEIAKKIDFKPDIEFLMYCNEIYGKEVE